MASFAEALAADMEDVNREAFINAQEAKAHLRKPKRIGMKPTYGTLFANRNWRLSVREAALRGVQVVLTYRKITTGETKKYVVFPYSYRYRRLRSGRKKMLFAYDMRSKHIKGYVVRNVKKAVLTDRKHKPIWPVEIG